MTGIQENPVAITILKLTLRIFMKNLFGYGCEDDNNSPNILGHIE